MSISLLFLRFLFLTGCYDVFSELLCLVSPYARTYNSMVYLDVCALS